ncbi:MAG: 30S ribosomal protein S13 [Candidatus Bathyarchaeia archaeon]
MPREVRQIVRLAGVDLDGTISTAYALSRIEGIGIQLAHAILRRANVKPDTRLGFLADADIEKIEAAIRDPGKYDIPEWLLNRRKDTETGGNLHLIGSDLELRTKSDIDHMKDMRSWLGYRHSYGLRARGQRTRTTGRKGKAVGVRKKRRPI